MKIALVVFTIAAASATATVAQQAGTVHDRIGYVMTAFNDTPKGLGLLPTAEAEAQIIARHATLAAKSMADLEAMKLHVRHIMHAIDPTLTENSGPGLGYGVKKAVAAATYHIEMAAKDKDASQNVKTHAPEVVASNTSAIRKADELIDLAQRVGNTRAVTDAAALVAQINAAASALVGALQQAHMHMALMKEGES